MAKYCFKVSFNDGSSRNLVPSLLDNNNIELIDMDKFVYQSGGIFEFRNLLALELGIKSE